MSKSLSLFVIVYYCVNNCFICHMIKVEPILGKPGSRVRNSGSLVARGYQNCCQATTTLQRHHWSNGANVNKPPNKLTMQ